MDDTIDRAKNFAAWAHGREGQARKYTLDRYIVHPASVAQIVSDAGGDDNMIAAAWLHDVVEDTPVTVSDVSDRFGKDVANLVSDLTDVSISSDGNRKIRKEIDKDHTAKASARAKTIKLADLIHNAESIVRYGKGFAPVFIEEKKSLLEMLDAGNTVLWNKANSIVNKFFNSK